MLVGELKRLLEKFPDNHEILLSSDADGNEFKKLNSISSGRIMDELEDGELIVTWKDDWKGGPGDRYPGDDAVFLFPIGQDEDLEPSF